MEKNAISFTISKSFAKLFLTPDTEGLKVHYAPVSTPVSSSEKNVEGGKSVSFTLPLPVIGGVWATTKAFLAGGEALDENVSLDSDGGREILVKLYRDKPKGAQGRLSGEENVWLRIVSGNSEDERRRIKLGARDLISLELACSSVMMISISREK